MEYCENSLTCLCFINFDVAAKENEYDTERHK